MKFIYKVLININKFTMKRDLSCGYGERFLSSVSRNSCQTNDYRKKIIENTIICDKHLTPEISLRLITSECKIYHQGIDQNNEMIFNDPFWGFYWPGGQAVARYILDNPDLVSNKQILDVGSGSGACAIASMLSGATEATANDIDSVALLAATINAELNSVQVKTDCNDLTAKLNLPYDCILLGDVFYDVQLGKKLISWLLKLKNEGKMILIGDPGRHGLTEKRLENFTKLIQYDLPENCCIENNGFKYASVWTFK